MTSLMNTAIGKQIDSSITVDSNRNFYHCDRRHVLKFKPKCNKVLKRKLRKYRLRRDGKEDQDVLDVSATLISILKIKSPNQRHQEEVTNVAVGSGEPTPKNYLFKMVRRNHNIKSFVRSNDIDVEIGKPIEGDIIESSPSASPSVDKNVEKKHTNAFKLLMASRNKSIGSNSPGKEKVIDECESQEIIEKKNIKAKRQLLLQKMANAKGAVKKKEVEEFRESVVKKKMEKRADKFKNMLLQKEPNPSVKKSNDQKGQTEEGKACLPHEHYQADTNVNGTRAKTNTLHPVDIFDLSKHPINNSPMTKKIPKEDEEFLKKLSPSLRKKENMLCYFNKVDKEPDQDETGIIIKVKFKSKTKKKGNKKKLSLNKATPNAECLSGEEESVTLDKTTEASYPVDDLDQVKESNVGRKRKRKVNITNIKTVDSTAAIETLSCSEIRPKRNIRKPIKYNEDFISSSDEELHIFTPKKKKHIESKTTSNIETILVQSKLDKNDRKQIENKTCKDAVLPKKPSKLAPIFTVKPQVDVAAMEAKQKFLQSGVPDKLKKIIAPQKERNPKHNDFLPVGHVQQLNVAKLLAPVHSFIIPDIFDEDEDISIKSKDSLIESLLDLTKQEDIYLKTNTERNKSLVLQNIKQSYPKFPVYRTYHQLRDKSKGEHGNNYYKDVDNSIELLQDEIELSNDNLDRLTWTEKYKAMSSNHIIGNFGSIKELKKWLEHWTENNKKTKANSNADSDSSDFYASDVDSRDSMKPSNNLLILTGPVGSGKTSSVYAVAAELAIKVIEVNASHKRTGKIILQDLQEATQSHKVNRGNLGSENLQKSQELVKKDLPKKKNRGRPKKVTESVPQKPTAVSKYDASSSTALSQEAPRTALSLILIDDADIVFDQDDGFCSAIVQLVLCSKRPVILVSETLGCPHLQRFIQGGKILKMNPLSPRVLGTWLDIMCLADNGTCSPGIGAKFLNYYQGDIRKTINSLQFYISTQEQGIMDDEPVPQNSEYINDNMDENSSMSWVDHDVFEGKRVVMNANDIDTIWKCFVDKQANLIQIRYPLKVFNVWWSLPSLLNITTDREKNIEDDCCKTEIIKKLESIANATDAISISDYLRHIKCETEVDITSQPWYSGECNSVSEQENLDSFHTNYEIIDEISHNMISTSVFMAQETLGCPSNTDIHFPEMYVQRERDLISSRHNSLTGFLNPSAVLDRRSLALDYWSSCRAICRAERCKTDTNSKRNNRFCHYLKSLNILCKNDYFDHLCNSLRSSGKSDIS